MHDPLLFSALLCEVSIITSILEMNKLRLRGIQFCLSHAAKRLNLDLHTDLLAFKRESLPQNSGFTFMPSDTPEPG